MTAKTINRVGILVGAAGMLSALVMTAFVTTGPNPADELAIPVHVAPAVRGTTTAELASAPMVPSPIVRDYATKVIVNLDVIEKEMEIADGTTYKFWTFGGSVIAHDGRGDHR